MFYYLELFFILRTAPHLGEWFNQNIFAYLKKKIEMGWHSSFEKTFANSSNHSNEFEKKNKNKKKSFEWIESYLHISSNRLYKLKMNYFVSFFKMTHLNSENKQWVLL